ncbi:zinc finger protein, putative [Bodo saltans]|uniref:Zinc finger protein, putative n=1 Tax=Bodo saltans TaxID=75058 RepID=A0A0S4KLQ4_BODSA|nr:zinc finger protein, putative [Bodo saltans]|eukprot:CUI14418.1 zinc finger protein, putative [Bodo saltans]
MGNKGSTPSNWKPDTSSSSCDSCGAPFSLLRRRHHCRNCGGLFCDTCSSGRCSLPSRGFDESVRVCCVCSLRMDAMSASSTPVTPTRRRSDVLHREHLNAPRNGHSPSSAPSSRARLMTN